MESSLIDPFLSHCTCTPIADPVNFTFNLHPDLAILNASPVTTLVKATTLNCSKSSLHTFLASILELKSSIFLLEDRVMIRNLRQIMSFFPDLPVLPISLRKEAYRPPAGPGLPPARVSFLFSPIFTPFMHCWLPYCYSSMTSMLSRQGHCHFFSFCLQRVSRWLTPYFFRASV